jgi:homoserine kinase
VIVPGSVANLGGGFDTLGVAVKLYLRTRIIDVRDDGGTKLVVGRSVPPVSGHNAVERAFATIAGRTGRRTPTVYVEVESDIPMAAGLGSSAAATVAGVRLFERFAEPSGGALSEGALLGAATAVEGHADNAAPALFGGLTSVMEIDGQDPVALRWTWPDELRLVVATPTVGLATARARAALAHVVSRRDAIFNLQRVLALVHALHARDYPRLREAVRDRWHQTARAGLVPLLGEMLSLEDSDVLGAFLSGAGPSVALLAVRNIDDVVRRVSALYAGAGVEAAVRVLGVHQAGVTADAVASSVGRAT